MRTALLVGLALLGPATADAATRRALVVGANDGGGDLVELRYAHNDAWRFAEVLTTLGGFDESSVTVLSGPTAEQLGRTLNEIGTELRESDSETLFVFYYSGHADARGLQLYDQVYSYEDLKASIRQVDADVHLGVLDACRSGAVTRVKGAYIEAPFLEDGLDAEGEAWLAASAADEDAQESDRLQGSFFTHYLVSGMRGAADTGDGWVSLNEAYAYAYDRTVARTAGTDGGTQHPSYDFRLQGNGDLRLTEMQSARANVVLPIDTEGEITVLRSTDGMPVAEVAKLSDRQVTLALEPGTYVMKKRSDGKLRSVKVHLAENASVTIDRWGDELMEEGTSKGESDGVIEPVDEAEVAQLTDEAAANQPEDAERGEHSLVYGTEEEPVSDKRKFAENTDDAYVLRVPKRFPDMPELGKLNLKFDPDDLKNRRGIAAGASLAIPGTGQMYTGRWADGLGFLLGTSLLNGGVWTATAFGRPETFEAGGVTGPNLLTWAGIALYAWNVHDASYGAKKRRHPDLAFHRPSTGLTMSLETVWHDDPGLPHASGAAVDWIVVPGFSVGLDRTGYIQDTQTQVGDVRMGGRAMFGVDTKHFRPAAFVAAGVALRTGDEVRWREILGVGGNVRYYPTPRYFMQYEGRLEFDPARDAPIFTNGLGLGVHIGGGDGKGNLEPA